MKFRTVTIATLLTMLAACGPSDDPADDAGSTDTGAVDMGTTDTGGAEDTGGPAVDMGSDDTGTPIEDAGGPDSSTDMSSMDMGGVDMSACSRQGFDSVTQGAIFDVPNDQFLYTAYNGDPMGDDVYAFISFEIYPYLGGTVGAQNYPFPGENYADCNTCLLIFADCQRPDPCEKVFLVDTGTVDVAQADTMDGATFQATFTDLVLNEVTIDTMTFESTVVPNGETWCIDSLTADTTVARME